MGVAPWVRHLYLFSSLLLLVVFAAVLGRGQSASLSQEKEKVIIDTDIGDDIDDAFAL